MGGGSFLALLLGALIVGGAFAYASLTANLPAVELLPVLLEPPGGSLLEPTRIYDRTGEHLLATLAPADAARRYIPIDPAAPEHLPDDLVRATIRTASPVAYDSYESLRVNGGAILIDETSYVTVAAVMIQ